ncbi:efflux RND transporter periplasmic adaptor subunit [Azonexus hydrophilus]|uniref:efflux RND transporter periplasmic adaptor subunit n=1 Tax=Azonexus hydrophilus TaxID=418702 RepID=UPI0024926C37|nr:efflux RND transporter periplasmic adaptor subunit [Azonexus hydrophilus]
MNKMKRRGVLALSFAGLLGLGYYAWSANRSDAPAPAPAQKAAAPAAQAAPARPVAVEVATVLAVDFADDTTAVGTLKAAESVVLRPEVSGRITRIGFRDGALVNKGDLLIAFDATIPDAELAQAQANRDLALASFKRNQELLEKKFISPQALDASAATLKVQEAAVQLAAAKAAKMRIQAPFRGIVGLRDVSVGSYIKEGEALVNIEDVSSLRVDFRLAETWLERVKAGQSLELGSDALPGQRFVAKVEAIDPQIDPNGRSIAVRARLDNAAGQLRPGMFVRLRLAFGERKGVLMVPEEAIMPGAKPAVFKVVDGKAERVVVRTGIRRDAQVEIVDGLAAGDVVVSAGQLKLRPGAPVTVPGAKAPEGAQGKP